MAIVGGFYETGQELQLHPGFAAVGAKMQQQLGSTMAAAAAFRGSEAEIQVFLDGCSSGNIKGCQALMKRAQEAGEPCAADGVAAMFPGELSCDCSTNVCTSAQATRVGLGSVPTWAWIAAAGAVAALLYMRRG